MLLSQLLESPITDEKGRTLGRLVEVVSGGRPRDGEPERATVQTLLYRPHGWTRRLEAEKTIAWGAVRRCAPGRIVIDRS